MIKVMSGEKDKYTKQHTKTKRLQGSSISRNYTESIAEHSDSINEDGTATAPCRLLPTPRFPAFCQDSKHQVNTLLRDRWPREVS